MARHGSLVSSVHGEEWKSGLEFTGREIEVRPGVYVVGLVSSLHWEKMKPGLESTQPDRILRLTMSLHRQETCNRASTART
jgi:hypothetical protein